MKRIFFIAAVLSSALYAENDFQEAQIADLGHEIAKADDIKKQASEIERVIGDISSLKVQNAELQAKLAEKETRVKLLTDLVDKLQLEVVKYEKQDVQTKAKLQQISARQDNLAIQLDEVQRKLSTKK